MRVVWVGIEFLGDWGRRGLFLAVKPKFEICFCYLLYSNLNLNKSSTIFKLKLIN